MARKSIKGYSEKNYYDNTKFSGVTATYDVLNEGSFRHMANLDISDTGKSVTPRKGYLTTEFVDNEGSPIALTKNTIYFQEPTTGEYVFLDFSSVDQTIEEYYTVEFNPSFIWSCNWSTVSNSYVTNSIKNSDCIENISLYSVGDNYYIPSRIVFKKDVHEIYLTSYLKYWGESDYNIERITYVITKEDINTSILLLMQEEMLSGSSTLTANLKYNVVSTNTNIILELNKNELAINASSLYNEIHFTGAKREYDSSLNYLLDMSVFKTLFSVVNNKFTTTSIANVNAQDLLNYLNVKKNELIHLKPVNNNFAEIIYDEYGVKQNVIKVDYLGKQFWINLIYNKNEDMLYLTPVHTEDPVGILSGDRNIASDQSIIPDPIYQIYETDRAPIGHYNRIPMIYAEQNGKYLVETSNTLNGLKLKPSFFIEDFADDDAYEWAYTYDIRSTSALRTGTYNAPIYKLSDGVSYTAPNLIERADSLIYGGNLPSDITDNTLQTHVKQLEWDKDTYLSSNIFSNNNYIIYVVPNPEKDSTLIDSSVYVPLILDSSTVYYADNEYRLLMSLLNNRNVTQTTELFDEEALSKCTTLKSIRKYFSDKDVRFFVVPLSNLNTFNYTSSVNNYLYNYYATCLYSNFMVLPNSLYTIDELIEHFTVTENLVLNFKQFDTISSFIFDPEVIKFSNYKDSYTNADEPTNGYIIRNYINAYFPINTRGKYFLCTVSNSTNISLFINAGTTTVSTQTGSYERATTFSFPVPKFSDQYVNATVRFTTAIHDPADTTLFLGMVLSYDLSNAIIKRLADNFFFDNGIDLTFYLLRYPKVIPEGMNYDIYGRELLISSTTLFQSSTIILDNNEPTYIPEYITEEPKAIMESKNTIVFRDTLGDHLVVWNNNQVFVSEPNTYYYFKYTGMFSYPAKVIKVIQYKDTLLVFTAQDLYSIFPYESTVQVQDGTDDEGNPKYVQSKVITYNTLPVLYNLMVDEKYIDAIQVFNQMVLFYSADGQMFMIKPTATIDSNTRFSIQYFNKSANDILANYDVYINERLKVYDIKKSVTKDDVVIKVSVNINYIKIFYCVPNVITYILIYDVVNNYYYVYDTITYTHITNILLHEGYEMYCTEHKERYYITLPYRDVYSNDNNTDIACYNNFYKHSINTELDTGNINLNNHIKKRFRNLYTTYKNINAHKLMYTVESFLDDVPVLTSVQDTIEVKDVEGRDTYTPVQVDNKVDLLAENTALFDFSAYNVNKIITHKSNIISSGKSFRLRLRFASKGKYKILGYGLVYKEYHV